MNTFRKQACVTPQELGAWCPRCQGDNAIREVVTHREKILVQGLASPHKLGPKLSTRITPMLSIILTTVRDLFVRPTESPANNSYLSPEEQLQSELAEAAQHLQQAPLAMVATRSRDHDDHALSAGKAMISPGTPTVAMSSGKRKKVDRDSNDTKPRSSTKRRKVEEAASTLENTPMTLAAVVIPTTNHETPGHNNTDLEKGSKDIGTTPETHQSQGVGNHPSSRDQGGQNGMHAGLRQIGEAARPQTPVSREDLGADTEPNPVSTAKATPSPRTKAKKSRSRDARMDLTTLINVSPHAPSASTDGRSGSRQLRYEHLKVKSLINPSPRPPSSRSEGRPESRHQRFANGKITFGPPIAPPGNSAPEKLDTDGTIGESKAEISRLGPSSVTPITRGIVEDIEAESSSDEAPEVVTKSSGQEKARSAAAEATKAAEAQRTAEKQKRRERDTLLKLQAKATRKEAKQSAATEIPRETTADDDVLDQASPSPPPPPGLANGFKWSSNGALPALLPDEILAAEPLSRLPTPSPESAGPVLAKAPINRKQRFLEDNPKLPKDVRMGNVRIRVLEDQRAILPPRVSKASQSIRESWLAGRPGGRLGAKGKVMMERRKVGGGFVRR